MCFGSDAKRINIFLALLLIFATVTLCGCSSGGEASDSQASSYVLPVQTPSADPSEKWGFPSLNGTERNYDYKGADFRILYSSNSENDIFSSSDSTATEYDKSVAHRNEEIEKKLGIVMKKELSTEVCDTVLKLEKSDDSPELVYASGGDGISELMLYGCIESLYETGDADITMLGVSVSAVRQLSVYGQVYMLTGAPMRSCVDRTSVVAYDYEMMKKLGYATDFFEELVLEEKWTLDRMHSISKQASATLDAGFDIEFSGASDARYYLWKGLGAVTVVKIGGDVPEVAVYSGKNVRYFENVARFSDSVGGIAENGDSLFYIGTIRDSADNFACDFGILPTPAGNEGAEYRCVLDFKNTYFTVIPKNTENKRMSYDFLYELYGASSDTVYPLTVKNNAYKSERILDVVLKSRYFDFLDMYGIGHIVSTAFYANENTSDFDALLNTRAQFAVEALDIALRQTVGEPNLKQ